MSATFLRACQAARAGDQAELARCQERILYLRSKLVLAGPNSIAGVKAGVDALAIGSGTPVSPLQPLTEEQKRCVRDVKKGLVGGRYQMGSEPCPCGEPDGLVIAQTERYGLPIDTVQCPACGTLRFDPYLSAESLKSFYVDYYQTMYGRVPDPQAYLRRQASYGNRLLVVARSILGEGARIAEVGCAYR